MLTRLTSGLSVTRARNVRLLLGSQAVSLLGDGMFFIAIAFATLDVTGKASSLGIVLAAGMVPLVLLLAVAGVWADRMSRIKLMVGSDLGRAGIQALLAALLLTGRAELWHLITLNAAYGAASAFFQPSASGLLPQIVEDADDLPRINGISNVLRAALGVAGSALGGIIVDLASPGTAIALDSVTFVGSALLIVAIRIPPTAPGADRANRIGISAVEGPGVPHLEAPDGDGRGTFVRELAEGWHEVRSRRWLWVVILNASLFLLLYVGPLQVVGPVVAREDFGGATAWGLIMGAFSLGMAFGGIIAITGSLRRPMAFALSGWLVTSLSPLALAFTLPIWVCMLLFAIEGTAVGLFNVTWESAVQREIPEDRLSRVAAWDWTGSLLGMPLGMMLAGPAIALVGTEHVLWGMAASGLTLSVFLLSQADVRMIGARPVRERTHDHPSTGV